MLEALIIVGIISILSLLVIRARKQQRQSESRLGINEHPSTFDKPKTEMSIENRENTEPTSNEK